jgi:Domain of unknown function (DUF4145)
MKPQFLAGNVRANCPNCGNAVTTYECKAGNQTAYGLLFLHDSHDFEGVSCKATVYALLRCAGCGRGGLAEVHAPQNGGYETGRLAWFLPRTIDKLQMPAAVPSDIRSEFEEAENCASTQAWRAGSAMLRSTLEKTLLANGYTKGSLADRIDEAAADGVITAARSRRAHDNIRVLGNDVLHDAWRAVPEGEFDDAHRYAQRILEDLYDDRASVEALLKAKSRLP